MTSTSTPQPTLHWRSERPANPAATDHGSAEHSDEETVQQAALTSPTPIYTALARQWAAERRAVPGHFDQEWLALVDYATWRRRQPRGHPQGS